MIATLFGILKGILAQDPSDRTKQLEISVSPSATTGTKTTLLAAQTANRTILLPDGDAVLLTADSTATLTNKTIDGDDNTLLDISISSLKTVLADADTFIIRDGTGAVVSSAFVVPAGDLVGTTEVQTLTNKTIDADLNTITNIEDADIKVGAAINADKIADGSVSNTEYQYINSLTSNAQNQLNQNASDITTVSTNLANHIADPTDAHTASAITNVPSGNLVAIDVQDALNELQTEIDGLIVGAGWNLAGNTLTGGSPTTPNEVFGSNNNFDVVFRRNAAERMRLNTTGFSLNQGALIYDFSSNDLTFADALAGGTAVNNSNGGFVHGRINGAGSTIAVLASGAGAFGESITGSTIQTTSSGGLAFGSAATNAFIETVSGAGGLAFGTAVGAGSRITSSGVGSLAFGNTSGGGRIISSTIGSLCLGSGEGTSFLTSSGSGAIVHGRASGGGTMTASGTGATVAGFLVSSGSGMTSTSFGSSVHGHVINAGSTMSATNIAASSRGHSANGFAILASGESSLSVGRATVRDNTASGNDSIAYGDSNLVSGTSASAYGIGHTNPVYSSLLIGRYGSLTGTAGSWVSTDPAFALGNGTGIGTEATGYILYKDGKEQRTGAQVNTAIRATSVATAVSARTDRTIVCNLAGTGGAITLPAGELGLEYQITSGGAGAAVYTITPNGGDVLDTAVTATVAGPQTIKYLSGTWYLV